MKGRYIYIVAIVVGIFLWLGNGGSSLVSYDKTINASTYPRILAVSIIALALINFIYDSIGKGKTVKDVGKRDIAFILSSAVYASVSCYVGFFVGTFLFTLVSVYLLKGDLKAKSSWLFALGTTLVLMAIFAAFSIYLPDTPLI